MNAGGYTITTTPIVIAEIANILTSKRLYSLPREEVKEFIYDFLTLDYLEMPEKPLCLRAIEIFGQTTIDYTDAYLIAMATQVHSGSTAIISFDKGIDTYFELRNEEIVRVEP